LNTILIVEDDEILRQSIRYILEDKGFAVLEAENGMVAKEVIEKNPNLNLIISDIKMPKMGGIELTNWVLQNHKIPIILMSGHSDHSEAPSKSIGFLLKPFDQDVLIDEVAKILP
jgi:DNA-binding NtrC family response regulator